MAQVQGPREVILVNIKGSDGYGIFNDMYSGLFTLLRNYISIKLTVVNAVNQLAAKVIEIKPHVLLLTDEIVTKQSCNLLDTVVKPFISGGGLVILGCHFSSFTRPGDLDTFFSNLGLPWKSSEYNRTTFGISTLGRSLLTGVPEKFSVKAVQLANVEPEQLIYSPVVGGRTESHVFPPAPTNPNLAMAAFARIGRGAVAYIGDVNGEEGSNSLTAQFCLINW